MIFFSDKNSISIVPLKSTATSDTIYHVMYDNLQENKPRFVSKNSVSAFITTCSLTRIVWANWSAGTRSVHCTVIHRFSSTRNGYLLTKTAAIRYFNPNNDKTCCSLFRIKSIFILIFTYNYVRFDDLLCTFVYAIKKIIKIRIVWK